MTTINQIAKVCHQANKAYCETIGDASQVDWENTPLEIQVSAKHGVYKMIQSECTMLPSDLHESWMKEKLGNGWVYGGKKDFEKKTHPCLVKYDALPESQRVKDYIFSAVVMAMAHFGVE